MGTIHVTVALEGGCWMGHRSDQPGVWVLIRDAERSETALAKFLGPIWPHESYCGTTIAWANVVLP